MLMGSNDLLWDGVGGRQLGGVRPPWGTWPSMLTKHIDGCALGGKETATAASEGGRGLHPAPAEEEGL